MGHRAEERRLPVAQVAGRLLEAQVAPVSSKMRKSEAIAQTLVPVAAFRDRCQHLHPLTFWAVPGAM